MRTFLKKDDGFLELIRSNPDAAHMEKLLVLLVNRLSGGEDRYLVLDDVHCIHDEALTRTLDFFLRSMPRNFHLFMLSREDPPVYLGPLAVSGRLLYIDSRQMALSPEESAAFLRQTMGLSENEEELRRLADYAEGWVGGLQLAAAALAAGGRPGKLLRAGGGIAAEYLTREIFASLSEQERNFLTATGFLSYFDAGLCARLLNGMTKDRFEEMIGRLTARNLFIICIDEQNGVYRYHNILCEYLAGEFKKLPEEQKKKFHTIAAAFEARGDN